MSLVSVGEADFEVHVRGSGEPVLLIQTALFAEQLLPVGSHRALQDSYRVVSYYRRGYGRSSLAEAPGSIVRDANDSRDLLSVLGIERAHIVGVSYSAAVALQLAATAPTPVHTLTVIEPPPVHVANSEEFIAANRDLLELYDAKGASVALGDFLTGLVGPDWRAKLNAQLPGGAQQVQRDASTFFESDLPALLSWNFDAPTAGHIHQPVLYIGGSDSGPWFAAVRDLMQEWLSPEQEEEVEGGDHNLVVTHPGEVVRAFTDFVARHPIRH